MSNRKETNPKESLGIRKIPLSTVPQAPLAEVGLALMEGGRKYGRHNYRDTGVKASTYFDAAWRHLSAWYEGEDIDPQSGIHHVSKAIAGLFVLRDAQIRDMCIDDRPPITEAGWQEALQPVIESLFKKYPDSVPAYTQLQTSEEDNGDTN